jgi:hypothetical protein
MASLLYGTTTGAREKEEKRKTKKMRIVRSSNTGACTRLFPSLMASSFFSEFLFRQFYLFPPFISLEKYLEPYCFAKIY